MIETLSAVEIECVSGADGCDVIGGIAGGLLGGIAGVAGSAISSPIGGVFIGAVVGGGTAGAVTTICRGDTVTGGYDPSVIASLRSSADALIASDPSCF